MRELDEARSWDRAANGDGDAFGELFDAYHPRVYRHALRLTGNTHDAEDVLAGAFLQLWQRRTSVRVVDGSVLPWLLVTTTNIALNQRRGLRRHRAFLDRLPRQEQRAEGAEDQALHQADLDVDPNLITSIRLLGHTDQQLLALVALEDYPLRAAADALGISEQAARSRWQRIRRGLAQNYTLDSLALVAEN